MDKKRPVKKIVSKNNNKEEKYIHPKITLANIREVCKKKDGFHCQIRKVSFYVTLPLLYTPITPTQVTWIWAILGIAAAFFFYPGTYLMSIIGAVILAIAFLMDHIDGNIARFKRIFSDRGYFIDEIGSYILIPANVIAIGFGGFHKTGNLLWIWIGGITAFGYLVYTLICKVNDLKSAKGIEKNKAGSKNPNTYNLYKKIYSLLPVHFDYFIYAILILAPLNLTEWIIVYFGMMYNLLWFGRSVYDYLFGYKN